MDTSQTPLYQHLKQHGFSLTSARQAVFTALQGKEPQPMTALDTMFRKFINAGTHLIPIEKDDEIIGIVTIEDLIEEILGHEIEDETDRKKARG